MAAKKMSQAWDLDGESYRREPDPPRRISVVDGEGDIRRLNTEVLIRHPSSVQLTLIQPVLVPGLKHMG
jgi:hypothetical protein